MRVRIPGAAVGGAFPQWNCNCGNCRIARTDPSRAKPRTQSCIAISSDNIHWFLVNASPDIRTQIESFPELLPKGGSIRGSGIAGVLLTNADLDHTLGLFLLREGRRMVVYATEQVRRALSEGLRMDSVLESYCGVNWQVPSRDLATLTCGDGSPGGLLYSAFSVPGKKPRYASEEISTPRDAVGYRFVDEKTGGKLVVIPDVAAIDDVVRAQMSDADLLFFDGTFFDENEMLSSGAGTARASDMGHIPIGGAEGSLMHLALIPKVQRVYVHINNTNPILLEDSPQRALVEAAGVVVGYDGMEFAL
jgi:pyrroloquinoline quinone biosynthesis protein B